MGAGTESSAHAESGGRTTSTKKFRRASDEHALFLSDAASTPIPYSPEMRRVMEIE